MDDDPTPIRIPGRCAACGQEAFDLLTLHTRREQITATILGITWHVWDANDGDLVTCDCGARYVCEDVGDGRMNVVPEPSCWGCPECGVPVYTESGRQAFRVCHVCEDEARKGGEV